MIPLLIMAPLVVDGADLAGFAQAAAACDRNAVSRAVTAEAQRHGSFVLDSFAEQEAIVAARADLAARRRALRAEPVRKGGGDTAASLDLLARDLADRQQALDDVRTLDRLKQDATGYFRQLYIAQCPGKGA